MPGRFPHGWLQQLERLAVQAKFPLVLTLATHVLAGASDPRSEAMARYFIGQARINLAMPERGCAEVRRARALFEQLGDDLMVVECLDWEATALYLREDSGALRLAQEALRRCRLLSPSARSLHVRIQCHLGAIHIARHDWTLAIRAYEAAETAMEGVRDLGRLVRMYSDLCIAYMELGETERAVAYGRKAHAIHELVHDPASLARIENNLGLALMRHGLMDAAQQRLARSLEICEELGLEVGRSHVLLSLGELHARRGDPLRSRAMLGEAAALSERLGERATLASTMQWLGWIHEGRGERAEADRAFARALGLLAEASVTERLAECHARYAQVLEERGELSAAIVHWRQAMAAVRTRRTALDTMWSAAWG